MPESNSRVCVCMCAVLGDGVRGQVLKLADNQITTGVSELSIVGSSGSNERAFHIIKVICVAVENLVWAVKSDRGQSKWLE